MINGLSKLKSSACILVALATLLSGRAHGTDFGNSSTRVDPKIISLAKQWFYRFQMGKIDRSQLDARINAQLTDAMITSERKTLQAFGRPTRFIFLGSRQVQYATGYNFLITFTAARIVEAIALDADGKIGGIDFQPFAQLNR